jgi:ATP-dependent Clp protease ATP-binding subunit ClpC
MRTGRVEPELHALKLSAEELASGRREPPSSAHLLAAIARGTTPAAELLAARRLGSQAVLSAVSSVADEIDEPVRSMLQRAHDIAVRMGQTGATGSHVLVALLNEPRSAARRTVELLGVDVGRLRTAALQLALGVVRARRAQLAPARRTSGESRLEKPRVVSPELGRSAVESARKPSRAVSVPIVPQRPARPAPKAIEAASDDARGRPDSDPPRELSPPEARSSSSAAALAPATPGPTTQARGARFELDPQRSPTLCGLGKNLTLAAARGELDPVVVREETVELVLDVLAKREGNNPCLVGVAGVGKTSVVRGVAHRIAAGGGGDAAESTNRGKVDDRILIEIQIGDLLQGTGVRGALASRLSALRRELSALDGRVVLFFDEIHQLFADSAEEIASELKLLWARGELPCIGATTSEEYRRSIGADAALARRFSAVEVEEPSREQAYLVLDAIRPKLELHHGVRYENEALALGIGWSVRYLPGRALPDKAISILDLAGARARRRNRGRVDAEAVAEVVAELAEVPIERLLETDASSFLKLEETLAERIVGHAAPISRIARILRRNAAGLFGRRPIGTFLLLGPTGVGKTETAKAIAEVLFHSENAITRIDLSEYGEAHAVARLIGAPPGYIGHDAGGQLTEAVRRRPYQVILLDELEKAHPDVLNAFLGVLDEGRLTDGRGRTVDFTNTVILLTSNIGADEATNVRRRVGFGGPDDAERAADLEARFIARARATLAPELYNRFDEVLVYAPLAREEVSEIARRLLASIARALEEQRGVRLELGPNVVEFLIDNGGFEPALGARPLKRALARLVEAPLAEKILEGDLERGSTLLLDVLGDRLDLDVLPPDHSLPRPVSAAE